MAKDRPGYGCRAMQGDGEGSHAFTGCASIVADNDTAVSADAPPHIGYPEIMSTTRTRTPLRDSHAPTLRETGIR